MRLIDADALLDKQESLYMKGNVLFHGVTAFSIENAPTIDPESLRHTAHWENEDDFYGDSIVWFCSVCKDRFILNDGTPEENNYKYCPSCGAMMVNACESEE